MIEDRQARAETAQNIGKAFHDLVRERMTGLVEEADITSRVGQRLDDRFDGERLGGYRVRVPSAPFNALSARPHRWSRSQVHDRN